MNISRYKIQNIFKCSIVQFSMLLNDFEVKQTVKFLQSSFPNFEY